MVHSIVLLRFMWQLNFVAEQQLCELSHQTTIITVSQWSTEYFSICSLVGNSSFGVGGGFFLIFPGLYQKYHGAFHRLHQTTWPGEFNGCCFLSWVCLGSWVIHLTLGVAMSWTTQSHLKLLPLFWFQKVSVMVTGTQLFQRPWNSVSRIR